MDFTRQEERRISLYFRISIVIKGVISAVEILGGLAVFFIPVSYVSGFLMGLAQSELVEDPSDFVATHLFQIAQQFSVASTTFIAIYLLSRGLIKLILVIALLKNQLWAYPSSLVVLGLFVAYQVYQVAVTESILVIALTIFDLIVMWFIWREWQVLRFEEKPS